MAHIHDSWNETEKAFDWGIWESGKKEAIKRGFKTRKKAIEYCKTNGIAAEYSQSIKHGYKQVKI